MAASVAWMKPSGTKPFAVRMTVFAESVFRKEHQSTPQARPLPIRQVLLALDFSPGNPWARHLAPGIRHPLPAPARFHFPVAGTAPPFKRASFTSTPGPDIGEAVQAAPPDSLLYGKYKARLFSERRGIPALVQGSRFARFRLH